MACTQCIHPLHPNIHSFRLLLSYFSLISCIPTHIYCIIFYAFLFFFIFQSCLFYSTHSLGLVHVFGFSLHSWLMWMLKPLLLFIHKLMKSRWFVSDSGISLHFIVCSTSAEDVCTFSNAKFHSTSQLQLIWTDATIIYISYTLAQEVEWKLNIHIYSNILQRHCSTSPQLPLTVKCQWATQWKVFYFLCTTSVNLHFL
jgi:hypothetical protein